MVMCLYSTSFDYLGLMHAADLKPERLKLAASKLQKIKKISDINDYDTDEPRGAFCITPSWPPFSDSVRLIENRLTEIFSVNRLTENIPN